MFDNFLEFDLKSLIVIHIEPLRLVGCSCLLRLNTDYFARFL